MTTSAGGNATFDAEAENENAIHRGVNRSHSNAIRLITRSVSAGAEIKGTERRTGAACGQRHSLDNRSLAKRAYAAFLHIGFFQSAPTTSRPWMICPEGH